MRLFSLVSERPPSCTQKSCNRQRDVSRTCPVSPRLNANEEATQCGYCGCHNRAAPSSLTSNGHAHLPHSPTTSCIIPYLSDENERRLIHDQMLLLLFFFKYIYPCLSDTIPRTQKNEINNIGRRPCPWCPIRRRGMRPPSP